MTEQYSILYIYIHICKFIYIYIYICNSSVMAPRLICTVNSTAINMDVQVPQLEVDLYSFRYMPRTGTAGYDSSMISF
jgi:hypothetical protein